MKNMALCLSLSVLTACVSKTPSANSDRVPANATNAAIVAAINSKLADAASLDNNGNVLIDSSDNGQQDKLISMEDCRKVSIRQAILDASISGSSNLKLSRKASHRVNGPNDLTALVGLRGTSNSVATDRTYSYLLDDPSDGQCSIQFKNAVEDSLRTRAQVEQDYATKLIAKDPKTKDTAVSEAAKRVDKLIRTECEQNSLNNALSLASKLYVSKHASNPIMVLDFRRSSALWSGQAEGRPQTGRLAGHWAFLMMDSQGKNLMQAKVGFQLQSAANDQCVGAMETAATEIVD